MNVYIFLAQLNDPRSHFLVVSYVCHEKWNCTGYVILTCIVVVAGDSLFDYDIGILGSSIFWIIIFTIFCLSYSNSFINHTWITTQVPYRLMVMPIKNIETLLRLRTQRWKWTKKCPCTIQLSWVAYLTRDRDLEIQDLKFHSIQNRFICFVWILD